MSKRCNHKWVNIDEKTREKICIKCGKKAMQAVMYMPLVQEVASPITQTLTPSYLRETITINTGESNLGLIKVYKDEVIDNVNKQLFRGFMK